MFLETSGYSPLERGARRHTAELLRIFLLDSAQAKSDRVTITHDDGHEAISFNLPSFTGTVKIRAENRLELTYMVANLQQYAETEVFDSLEAAQHFLGRMIKVIRHYALPILDRHQN
jgi:hypothetical protein